MRWGVLSLLLGGGAWALTSPIALAQPIDLRQASANALATRLPVECSNEPPATSDRDIEHSRLTLPSLWLARDLFGGKLVDRWATYLPKGGQPPRVEVTLNPQPWNNLGYLRQYSLAQSLGKAADQDGYALLLCDDRRRVLATYRCGPTTTGGNPAACDLVLGGGLSVRLRLF